MDDVQVCGLSAAVEYVNDRVKFARKNEDMLEKSLALVDSACRDLTGYGIDDKITAYEVLNIIHKILVKEGLINDVP